MLLFLILTPLLLLLIVSLLGFVGCSSFAGGDIASTPTLTITTKSPLADATVNVHYGTSLAATGGVAPYHWSIVGANNLPGGITIDDTGTISGTPTAIGTFSQNIQVKDSPASPDPKNPVTPQTAQQTFQLDVKSSVTAPKITAINPTSGSPAGGTVIIVGGSNFVAGATLALGGAPASGVTVVSNTTINATTGPHAAGAVDVVVTNPDSQFGTLAKGFTYVAAGAVTHFGNTDIASAAGATTTSLESAAIPLTGAGSKLLVVTVVWGGGGAIVGGVPTFMSGGGGATFKPVAGAAPWNAMQVQNFYANGVPSGTVQVRVLFSVAAPTSAKLCTSAYDNVAAGNPTFGAVTTPDGKTGTNLQAAGPINANALDLVYAVGLAATSAGQFPGGITVNPGTGFIGEPGAGNPLIEDKQITAAGNVTPTATNATGGATSRWFMFAMGIKHV
jgi:IPT/TIG domain-containing protein